VPVRMDCGSAFGTDEAGWSASHPRMTGGVGHWGSVRTPDAARRGAGHAEREWSGGMSEDSIVCCSRSLLRRRVQFITGRGASVIATTRDERRKTWP